eukprot:gene1196-biopygen4755
MCLRGSAGHARPTQDRRETDASPLHYSILIEQDARPTRVRREADARHRRSLLGVAFVAPTPRRRTSTSPWLAGGAPWPGAPSRAGRTSSGEQHGRRLRLHPGALGLATAAALFRQRPGF